MVYFYGMTQLFSFDTIQAGLLILMLLVFGDFLSRKCSGRVPSMLFAGLLFMLISWTGLIPVNIAEIAGLSGIATAATGIVIVGMGASMSIRTFIDNWRVTVLAIVTYLTQAALLMLVLSSLYGVNLALGAIPGGSMTALIVQQRAAELGYDDTIVLSVLFFSTQGLVACLIAGRYVKRESDRLLALPPDEQGAFMTEPPKAKKDSFFSTSTFGNLAKVYIVSWLAARVGTLIGINQFILCMIFGVLFAAIGFIDHDTINQSGAEAFFFFALMGTVMSGYSRATPQMFAKMLVPLTLVLLLESGVIFVVSPLLGRLLGFTRDMSISLGSNIMMGFPLNIMISNGIAEALTDDPAKRELLQNQIATRMVIAGLSTTTTLAVLTGGLLVNLMH